MSKVCEITGREAMFGNNGNRFFPLTKLGEDSNVNLFQKTFYIPEEDPLGYFKKYLHGP